MDSYETRNMYVTLQSEVKEPVQIELLLNPGPIPRQIMKYYNILATPEQPKILFDYFIFGKMLTASDLFQVAMFGFDINCYTVYNIKTFYSYSFEIEKSQNKDFSVITSTENYIVDWLYLHSVLTEEVKRIEDVVKLGKLTPPFMDALIERAHILRYCIEVLKQAKDPQKNFIINQEITELLISLL